MLHNLFSLDADSPNSKSDSSSPIQQRDSTDVLDGNTEDKGNNSILDLESESIDLHGEMIRLLPYILHETLVELIDCAEDIIAIHRSSSDNSSYFPVNMSTNTKWNNSKMSDVNEDSNIWLPLGDTGDEYDKDMKKNIKSESLEVISIDCKSRSRNGSSESIYASSVDNKNTDDSVNEYEQFVRVGKLVLNLIRE